jgi:hypothetical protein
MRVRFPLEPNLLPSGESPVFVMLLRSFLIVIVVCVEILIVT